jgi:protein-disulfide isomerase
MSSKPEGAKRALPFIIIGVVLVAVIAAMLLVSRSNNSNASQENTSQTTNNSTRTTTPGRIEPGAPNPHVRGGEHATVTLEEFADFQCPACGGLDPKLRQIEKDYGDRIRLIFRNFPLMRNHKYAFIAARAAEAAGMQGKFWEMHDVLYDNQEEWTNAPEPRTNFDAYASRLGLDGQRFRADMERQEIADRVMADYNRGISMNVSGTPSIYLNGKQLSADDTLDEKRLRVKIDEALSTSEK